MECGSASLFSVGSSNGFQVNDSGQVTAGTWQGTGIGVSYGGTGAGTFTTNGLLYGNSTSALQVTAAGTSGQLPIANASGIPTFVSMSGDATIIANGTLAIASDSIALTTDTTGNYVASITNGSGISGGNGGSEGSALTLALGALTADWNQTGAFDISLNNASSELKILESAGATYFGILDTGDLTADSTYTFSGATGTVWTSGNDGSGSTLDADTLDGHDTAYFQTALTNPVTGTGTNGYNAYWTGTGTLGSEQYTAVSRGGTGLSGASD